MVFDSPLKKLNQIKIKIKKKHFGNHQVPQINSKNGQGELTTPEIKKP